MALMQIETTPRQTWLRVKTRDGGITWLPVAELGLYVRNSEQRAQPLTDKEFSAISARLCPYLDELPTEWENVMGCGFRLSAPGYLDCTEWEVFATPEELAQRVSEENEADTDDSDESEESEGY